MNRSFDDFEDDGETIMNIDKWDWDEKIDSDDLVIDEYEIQYQLELEALNKENII